MQEDKLFTTEKSEAHELFKQRNEYFVENDEYEEALELHRKSKAVGSALNTLRKEGGLECRTCQA